MERARPLVIEYGVATLVRLGESHSGDRYVVAEHPRGFVVAVVDGVGHGAEAAFAADLAVATLEAHAHEDVSSLVQRCHERLRRTRGAVATIASVDTLDGRMSWGGVGDVEGVLVHAEAGEDGRGGDFALLRGGILGHFLPPFRPTVTPTVPGDTLILATDGINPAFLADLRPAGSAQQVADSILRRHALESDDALVLVANLS